MHLATRIRDSSTLASGAMHETTKVPPADYSTAPPTRSSARCTLARLTPIDRATDDTDDPATSRFRAHLVRNPGMVPNETICGVRRFHRVVFQRCVRCPPILHESFKKLGQPRLPSQSATRPEHRYRLQMKLCRGF